MSFSLFEIVAAFIFGYFLKKIWSHVNQQYIATILIYFFTPIVSFYAFQKYPFSIEFGMVILVQILVLFITFILFFLFFKTKTVEEKALLKTIVLTGNTGLGVPLCIFFFTEQSLPLAITLDLFSGFLVWTFGVYFLSRGKTDVYASMKKIFSMPYFYAIMLSIVLQKNGILISPSVMDIFSVIAKFGYLLAFSIIGMVIVSFSRSDIEWSLLYKSNIIRFLLVPFVALFVMYFLPFSSLAKQVFVVQMAVPVPIFITLFSVYYELVPKKAAMLTICSTLLAIATLPLWGYGVKMLF